MQRNLLNFGNLSQYEFCSPGFTLQIVYLFLINLRKVRPRLPVLFMKNSCQNSGMMRPSGCSNPPHVASNERGFASP